MFITSGENIKIVRNQRALLQDMLDSTVLNEECKKIFIKTLLIAGIKTRYIQYGDCLELKNKKLSTHFQDPKEELKAWLRDIRAELEKTIARYLGAVAPKTEYSKVQGEEWLQAVTPKILRAKRTILQIAEVIQSLKPLPDPLNTLDDIALVLPFTKETEKSAIIDSLNEKQKKLLQGMLDKNFLFEIVRQIKQKLDFLFFLEPLTRPSYGIEPALARWLIEGQYKEANRPFLHTFRQNLSFPDVQSRDLRLF